MSHREVVVVAVDINPLAWAEATSPNDLTFKDLLDQLFAYLSQMILCDVFQVAPIIAYNQHGAEWLFPDAGNADQVISGRLQATNNDEVDSYCKTIVENLEKYASECAATEYHGGDGVRLDIALSLALCHLNKYPKDTQKRIIVLTRSSDSTTHFESTMNAIFAAHRIGAVIDSVMIGTPSQYFEMESKESLFLNQAALLTNGFSITIKERAKCLMQYLLTIPPLPIREFIDMKRVKAVDYTTPAVDNPKHMIDVGYMCPICLSVFEGRDGGKKAIRKCTVCGVKERL